MKKQWLTLNTTFIWMVVILSLLLTVAGVLAMIQQWQLVSAQWISGFALLLLAWIAIIVDMNKNEIFNKRFWILSMLIIPSLTSVFYLIQRKKLIELGKEFGHK
jgi:predicted membrane channel-forming protein YqfA (hemolysin III family)